MGVSSPLMSSGGGLREHPVPVVPLGPGVLSLAVLPLAALHDQGDQLVGNAIPRRPAQFAFAWLGFAVRRIPGTAEIAARAWHRHEKGTDG